MEKTVTIFPHIKSQLRSLLIVFPFCSEVNKSKWKNKTRAGWKHIDHKGNDLNRKYFADLGVFHKNIATAKDNKGWFHINKQGNPLYHQRYLTLETFYNGCSSCN